MSSRVKRRLSPQIIQDDIDTYLAIKAIPNWQPANPKYSLEAISAAYAALMAADEAELHASHALAAARDAAIDSQREFHDRMVNTRTQAKAMFGDDSDEVVAVGLKKKSDRKPAKAKGPTPGSDGTP